jgi:hypothetical protein
MLLKHELIQAEQSDLEGSIGVAQHFLPWLKNH